MTVSKYWDACVLQRSAQRLDAYHKGKKYDDFFQALMEDKNGKPNNLEWGEINAEVNIMMNAGSTTTAIAMANVLYHILKHPPVLERVRKEIDNVLDVDEVIAPYHKAKNLPYLRACLAESLRIFSPTTHGLGRKTPQKACGCSTTSSLAASQSACPPTWSTTKNLSSPMLLNTSPSAGSVKRGKACSLIFCELNHVHDVIISPAIYSLPFARPSNI